MKYKKEYDGKVSAIITPSFPSLPTEENKPNVEIIRRDIETDAPGGFVLSVWSQAEI